MSTLTRDSLLGLRHYWASLGDSPFQADALAELETALAAPEPLSHDQWVEYFDRLAGPEGCDFKTVDGDSTWKCGSGDDKSRSEKILRAMGLSAQIEDVHRIVNALGGHCDCEIIFNASGRIIE